MLHLGLCLVMIHYRQSAITLNNLGQIWARMEVLYPSRFLYSTSFTAGACRRGGLESFCTRSLNLLLSAGRLCQLSRFVRQADQWRRMRVKKALVLFHRLRSILGGEKDLVSTFTFLSDIFLGLPQSDSLGFCRLIPSHYWLDWRCDQVVPLFLGTLAPPESLRVPIACCLLQSCSCDLGS